MKTKKKTVFLIACLGSITKPLTKYERKLKRAARIPFLSLASTKCTHGLAHTFAPAE